MLACEPREESLRAQEPESLENFQFFFVFFCKGPITVDSVCIEFGV